MDSFGLILLVYAIAVDGSGNIYVAGAEVAPGQYTAPIGSRPDLNPAIVYAGR